MKSTTISKLKASLSEYLMRVKAGEELYITERGKTIAKIVAVTRDEEAVPPHLHELERAGLLRPGKEGLPRGFWAMKRPPVKGSAVAALLRDREEGR